MKELAITGSARGRPTGYPGLIKTERKDEICFGLYSRNNGVFRRLAITKNLAGFAILTRGDVVIEAKKEFLDTKIFLATFKKFEAKGEIKVIKAEGESWNSKTQDD
ncbi:MAG: hypothetical protein HY764_02025 [Candidatus Portnoybacteria bacterium]|nr:hypothetical protein [Candidatus Portnoybacteria bacterium]